MRFYEPREILSESSSSSSHADIDLPNKQRFYQTGSRHCVESVVYVLEAEGMRMMPGLKKFINSEEVPKICIDR